MEGGVGGWWRWGGVWNGEKETQKKGGSVFSIRCLPGLNESTCFVFLFPLGRAGGVVDIDWGMEERGGARFSSRDYFEEVWTAVDCIYSSV